MKKVKPVIGLMSSCDNTDNNFRIQLPGNYLSTLRHFGAIPVLLPVGAEEDELNLLLDLCDGVLLTHHIFCLLEMFVPPSKFLTFCR